MQMTTPTLPEILQRLREQPITWVKVSLDGKCGEIVQMDADALYARLMAVCDALEMFTKELSICREHLIDHNFTAVPKEMDRTLERITQKLAAALKL